MPVKVWRVLLERGGSSEVSDGHRLIERDWPCMWATSSLPGSGTPSALCIRPNGVHLHSCLRATSSSCQHYNHGRRRAVNISYLSSLLCPTQTRPPYRGAGLLQDRWRTWKPIPQEVLHGAQEDQGVQAPFLTEEVTENRVWVCPCHAVLNNTTHKALMGGSLNSLEKRLFISTRFYISRDLEKGVSKVLSIGLTFFPLQHLRMGKEENEASAEWLRKRLPGFAITLTGYSPVISPMSHSPAFPSQRLIPKLYSLDYFAQRVQVLRLTNVSCAKGCKTPHPLLIQ